MKIIIDNVKKENYECFNYPNKEIKKISIGNIKYKDIQFEFDSIIDIDDFICELIRKNLSGKDLKELLGEEFFK